MKFRYRKGQFQGGRVEGPNKVPGYSRMSASNFITGQLQEVILVDPTVLQDSPALTSDSKIELRADLDKAMSQFTSVQRRVIVAVLVEGQSVQAAVKRRVKTSAYWTKWLYGYAVPALKSALRDYQEVTATRGKELVIR